MTTDKNPFEPEKELIEPVGYAHQGAQAKAIEPQVLSIAKPLVDDDEGWSVTIPIGHDPDPAMDAERSIFGAIARLADRTEGGSYAASATHARVQLERVRAAACALACYDRGKII